jgi:hypothetical protein
MSSTGTPLWHAVISLCLGFEKPAIEFDENIITGECLESIVDYSYSGKINITEDNMYDLLLASDYLDITFIKTECEKLSYLCVSTM